jgi:galactose mutarotase-like enzyme
MAFTIVSADGDMGYPGLLAARVEYTVQPGAVLVMRYNAQLFGRQVCACVCVCVACALEQSQ